jgi:hypothetical protein
MTRNILLGELLLKSSLFLPNVPSYSFCLFYKIRLSLCGLKLDSAFTVANTLACALGDVMPASFNALTTKPGVPPGIFAGSAVGF